jgi:N-acetylglucosaminyldiphosphoundecaprenol N-acetyl-beta-D-mannosaminyltransferase
MGVGASFDYLTGVQKRAPAWAQQAGLEWLYRLLRQPWRLRRQMALPRFAALVMLESLRGARRTP